MKARTANTWGLILGVIGLTLISFSGYQKEEVGFSFKRNDNAINKETGKTVKQERVEQEEKNKTENIVFVFGFSLSILSFTFQFYALKNNQSSKSRPI